MSRTFKDTLHSKNNRGRGGQSRQRHISVRAVRRDPPDLRKLSRAVIQLALTQADAEAQAAAASPEPDETAAEQLPEETPNDR